MATIDTSVIEGFDTMTAEQKLDALLKLDVPEKVDLSGYIAKSQFDKVSSELADTKKQLKGRMSEDEAAKADNEAKWAAMEEKVARLEREKTESIYKAKYLAMPGFDEKLAEETAVAIAAGETDKVFANQQKAYAAYEKQLRAELVKKDPRPDGAGGGSEEKPDNVELARELGKQRAATMSATVSTLEKFKIGK